MLPLRLQSSATGLVLLAAFTLALHLPFIGQPPQSDEVNYLDIAAHVLARPLTPLDFTYVFMGHPVNVSGHPHPPLDAYLLAGIWRLAGHFSPVVFHSVYLLFALGISVFTYTIAARFTQRPLWAALLVASAPVIQVAGNSLETDALNLCLLLGGTAAFLEERFLWAGIFLALAGMTSLQSLAVALILLLVYVLKGEAPPRRALAASAAPFLVLGAWQALQFALTHQLPVLEMAKHATGPVFGRLAMRATSGQALLAHLGLLLVIVPIIPRALAALIGLGVAWNVTGYPMWERALLFIAVMLGVQILVWLTLRLKEQPFLAAWCLAYFAFCLIAFFAGAARYLMPMAVPLIILAVAKFEKRPVWFGLALAFNVVLGLNLAVANYDLGAIYEPLNNPTQNSEFLVDGELGFRYQMIRAGGRMLESTTVPEPGEYLVRSELCLGGDRGSPAEAVAVPLATVDLAATTPVRLMDRYAHAGYYSASFGLLPFSFSAQPLDTLTFYKTSPYLSLDAPWIPTQVRGHLVYIPQPGAVIHLPVERDARSLHAVLYAHGAGSVRFVIQDGADILFDRTVTGETWEVVNVSVHGRGEVTLSLVSPPGTSAGWGELVTF